MFLHWNCDFGTGFVISVPQITLTDSAEYYLGRKDQWSLARTQHIKAMTNRTALQEALQTKPLAIINELLLKIRAIKAHCA